MSSGFGRAVLPLLKLKGSGKNRANCSDFHLLAAEYACSIALDIEKRYEVSKPPSADLSLYVAQSSTTVMCSVAALESKINEFIVDNREQIDKHPEIIDPKIIAKYNLKGTILSKQLLEQTNVLSKYDVICLVKKGSIPHENTLTENVRYLVELRNALTHFTPEWDNELARHAKLKNRKKNRFTLSPFYPSEILLFVPYQCMCASCADWAFKTTSAFIEHFVSI